MKKIKIVLFCLSSFFTFIIIGCNKEKDTQNEKDFLKIVSDCKSYKNSGVIETNYNNNRKQNDFLVYYKETEKYKVVLKDDENQDEQIILKNNDGVNILIPSVNKNFKIKSTWPSNASYPYLLQSLAKDISNDPNLIITEDDTTYSIETLVKLHSNATSTKQKIIFSKETNLPQEVLIYDTNGDLFMRAIYTSIELDYNVSDEEFEFDKSMEQAKLSYSTLPTFENRNVELPSYYPEDVKFVSKDIVVGSNNVRTVLKFENEEYAMSIIYQLLTYSETTSNIYEEGEAMFVMNVVSVIGSDYITFIDNGILYTFATSSVKFEELYKVAASYLVDDK